MNRRKFLQSSLTGAAGAGLLAACSPAQPDGAGPSIQTRRSVQWRLASSFPRSLNTIYGAAEVLAERVEALSEGRFRIRVHPAGEIVPAMQVMDAVQQGTVQIGQTASYYYIGKQPALAFDSGVPFGFTSRQQTAWLTEGGGLNLVNGLLADFGILSFPAGNTGAQMGGWFREEIGSAEDLKGLKMRIPGLGGEVMSRLGVTVQLLPGGDIFPALERGAIDATEWVGPYDDEKLGFHKVAPYYYFPGWWEPGPSLSYHVHRGAWDSLSQVDQQIFTSAANHSATVMQARYDQLNPEAFARLVNEHSTKIRPFPKDLLLAAYQTTIEMHEERVAADATYRKIYNTWRKAHTSMFQWFGTAELEYLKFAATSA